MNELFNELKKLGKRANQRIVRLERLTGVKESFAVKQLADYLSSMQVNGWTKTGRVRYNPNMTETQMIATIKAVKDFLENETSRVAPVKKIKKEVEESLGFEVSYEAVSTIYQAQELWRWVEDEYGSMFWKEDAPRIFTETREDWVYDLWLRSSNVKDVTIKYKLERIYDYIKEHGLRGVMRFD